MLDGSNQQTNFGRVAEWPMASVLKTEVPQGTVGSNPTSSASRISTMAVQGLCNPLMGVRFSHAAPFYRGMEQWSARLPHKQEVVGSNPTLRKVL